MPWKGLLVADLAVSSYRYLADCGTDRLEILHAGTRVPDVYYPLLGAVSPF